MIEIGKFSGSFMEQIGQVLFKYSLFIVIKFVKGAIPAILRRLLFLSSREFLSTAPKTWFRLNFSIFWLATIFVRFKIPLPNKLLFLPQVLNFNVFRKFRVHRDIASTTRKLLKPLYFWKFRVIVIVAERTRISRPSRLCWSLTSPAAAPSSFWISTWIRRGILSLWTLPLIRIDPILMKNSLYGFQILRRLKMVWNQRRLLGRSHLNCGLGTCWYCTREQVTFFTDS